MKKDSIFFEVCILVLTLFWAIFCLAFDGNRNDGMFHVIYFVGLLLFGLLILSE